MFLPRLYIKTPQKHIMIVDISFAVYTEFKYGYCIIINTEFVKSCGPLEKNSGKLSEILVILRESFKIGRTVGKFQVGIGYTCEIYDSFLG